MKPFSIIIFLTFISLNFLFSQEDKGKWEVKDFVNQESASQVAFSPDGNSVVWVKRRPAPKKDRSVGDLYLTRLDITDKKGPKQIQLTRSDESDSSPFFSKDGELLYFLSSREKGNKLWALNMMGGEPYKVDSFPNGISSIQWLNDTTITYLASEGKTLYEQELKKKKDNVVVVEDQEHMTPRRVFSYNLKTKDRERLTDNEFPISEYEVSKDGKWIATTHRLSLHYASDGKPKPTHYIWNLEDGSKRQILQPYQTPGGFSFTGDSEGFYFSAELSSDPEWQGAGISLLYYYELSSNEITQVDLKHDWAMGGGYEVLGNDIIVSLANGTTNKLAYYTKNKTKWKKSMVDAGDFDEHISIMKISDDKSKIAYSYSTASIPNQYYITDLAPAKGKLTLTKGVEFAKLNKHLKNKKFAKTESRKWIGALGEEVTGMLYYPTDYEEGKSYPLMVAIHGGPSGVDRDRWSDRWAYYHNLLAQRGMFILKPNYHGSSNHGQKFVESIKGHYYEYELPDIIAGIDMLEKEGKIKRDSMAVMGWSNGAILATMLTVEYPDMFLAAGAGAGDVNWTSDYGTCRFGVTFDQSYFGGAPWDDVNGKTYNEAYILKSPLFEMEKVKTPTIIFHGSEDRAVPRDQGWEYYRALQQNGKAPVRFLWFPGQPHGLGKLTHQTRKITEELAWFDHYFLGTYEPKNESVKKESPLMALIEFEKVKKHNGVFGIMEQKTLIPEVMEIAIDSTSISCFEITNAQYQNFEKEHKYAMDAANHPVVGIGFEKAKAYAEWLSGTTGKSYRLPNAEEAKALHKKAKKAAKSENTLNYWAGYKITVDEVKNFRKKIETVSSSLLKAVGGNKATKIGKAKVYDLGGNAAEYFDDGGKAGTYGYSAYDYVDDSNEKENSPAKATGFRVILEKE